MGQWPKIGASAGLIAAAGVIGVYWAAPPGMFARALTAEEKRVCGLTAAVTAGPFYVSGVPELAGGNLNAAGLPGEALRVSGHVYEGLGQSKPLAGAEVEAWQTDNDGNYHPNGNGPATRYKSGEIALRGYVKAGADGAYAFTTLYPGEYSGRVRHIHIKVRAPGKPELTTQLILPARPGDELSFDDDTISQGLPDCHLLAVDASATPASARFDFRLE